MLEVVLKECRKDNLVYKIAALRCAGDVLQSSQQDCFSTLAEILFPLIKKVKSYTLIQYYLLIISTTLKNVLSEFKFKNCSQQSCPESGGASPRSLEEDDDDTGVKEKELQTEALLCAFEVLGKSWPRNAQTQGRFVFRTDTT